MDDPNGTMNIAEDVEAGLAQLGVTMEAMREALGFAWYPPSRRLKLLLKRQAADWRRSINGRSKERHLR